MTTATMWKARRRTILVLIILVALLLLLVLAVGLLGGGIDRVVRARGQAELEKLVQARRELSETKKLIGSWVEQEPELFAAQKAELQWEPTLAAAEERLETAEKPAAELRQALEKNVPEQTERAQQLVDALARIRVGAMIKVADLRDAAERLVQFKHQLDERLPAMKQDWQAVQAIDLDPLTQQVAKAAQDWPEKQSDLQSRVDAYRTQQQQALAAWEASAEARQRAEQNKISGEDVEQLVKVADQLKEARASLQEAPQSLKGLIDQLYWSWDKLLADMEIRENGTVSFRHKYDTVKIRAKVPEGEEAATHRSQSPWQTVSQSEFESMKDKLGMVVEHKPAGKYDFEASKLVQPPGFAYIAPVSQQSNQYGHWQRRSDGTSFWAFYGQYRMLHDVMGGRYVTEPMFGDYRRYHGTGRTYYGRDRTGTPLFGSQGAVTRQRYAASRYVSTGGFRNSQYVRSGGTYRGSRFTTRSRTSSRTGRTSRSYRSSSRSSGFRSSFGGK